MRGGALQQVEFQRDNGMSPNGRFLHGSRISTIFVHAISIFCVPKRALPSSDDREFFQWVADAAFANPFSEQRHELDIKIAGHFDTEVERGLFLKNAVSQRVRKLDAAGQAHLRFYSGEDRERMRTVFLFEA